MVRSIGCAAALWLILAPLAPRLEAQYPARSPYLPYGSPNIIYPSSPGTGYGNYLSGAADLTRASSEVAITNENARILREQVNQAKLDTKKKAFDQMLYEQSRTASYTEVLTQEKRQIINRIMNFPTRPEIAQGKTLNILLPFLQALSDFGTQGPPVPIPQFALHELNVGNSELMSVGMLRDGGHVDWPIALRGPQQKKLNKLLPEAYKATLDGDLDAGMLNAIRAELTAMRDNLRKQLQEETVEAGAYMQAVDFYDALDNSVRALERPDARKQLSGSFAPRAHNVPELVDYMTASGLKFAPANLGEENAYQAIHDSFVRYARAAQSSAGIQTNTSSMNSTGILKR